jgi:hypothetical protein
MSVLSGDAGSDVSRFTRFLLFSVTSSVFLITECCRSLAILADANEGCCPAE